LNSARPRLLFYCQHSLGLGHLSRSFALCESLAAHFEVVLICGGKIPPGNRTPDSVRVVPLPPVGAAVDGRLFSHDRRRSLERVAERRREIVLETFRSVNPETILIEFFPFGKKRFSGELLPLLQEADQSTPIPPIVACSTRDILVGRGSDQQEFDDRAGEIANRYFDVVLSHSDPAFARFQESFRPRQPLRIPVHHTGFVVSNNHAVPHPPATSADVIVSAGGGVVGAPLVKAAVEAHELLGNLTMKIITGPFISEDVWRSVVRLVRRRSGLSLVRSVPHLGTELRGARVSVSQCGYNTALDIVRARVPALVVPFAANGEDEQTRRARRLEDLGAVRVLNPQELSPHRLADEIRTQLRSRPERVTLDMEGGPHSVRILSDLHAARFGKKAS
jgi:predicted glycosyltransferase